jgi:sialidase-1
MVLREMSILFNFLLFFGMKGSKLSILALCILSLYAAPDAYPQGKNKRDKAAMNEAVLVRKAGDDGCHTFRIPGIITTSAGTLIAVYDIRYKGSKDLQADIDVGMSRSTDGGRTWEEMKVIIDMGEFGGLPQELNGAGDPCILYDNFTNTIWVAALWMSGSSAQKMLWWESKPGLLPHETGQIVLVKSTDEGISWTKPVNITAQVKDREWQLMLQGPGRGITMKDGTLVFPAQYKYDAGTPALDGGKYTCQSTIIYSKDHGLTWSVASGAKDNTTEAQLVELPGAVLMLNMRDDRNRTVKDSTNGRAVATSSDMGKTWLPHPSSNSALPEPNCMASLISKNIRCGGKRREVLFFSNPANTTLRTNLTIKASTDYGLTWPTEYYYTVREEEGYGYSCLTMLNNRYIGILYEGKGDLFFKKIRVNSIFKKNTR